MPVPSHEPATHSGHACACRDPYLRSMSNKGFSSASWTSNPRHRAIGRRRRCVGPWGPLRASDICSLSRASHPLRSSLSRRSPRSASLLWARLLRREKSPRAPSRCSTGVHVLAARDGIRPEGTVMGLPRFWCRLTAQDRPSRPLLLQRTAKAGISEIAIDLEGW